MANIVTFPSPVNISVNPDDTLEEHAAEIRKGLQDMRRVWSNALDIALAVGQRLNIAKDLVGDGKWSKWLRNDCEISRSSALLYMRLANHQGDIDAARVQLPNLSLRAARRLLTKSIEPDAAETEAKESGEVDGEEADGAAADHTADLPAAWEAASVAERRKVLAAITIPALLDLLSKEQITELKQRTLGNDRAQKKSARELKRRNRQPAPILDLQAIRILISTTTVENAAGSRSRPRQGSGTQRLRRRGSQGSQKKGMHEMHSIFRISPRLRQPSRQRRSARRHVLDNGQRGAVLRAVTAAQLYTTGQISNFKDAAESCGSNTAYVQAAVVLRKAEDTRLFERVLRGDIPILQAAEMVKTRSKLIHAFRQATAEDRIALVQTVGPELVFDKMIGPALETSKPPLDATLARWRAMQEEAV